MIDSPDKNTEQVWQFIRGELDALQFEYWLYKNKNNDSLKTLGMNTPGQKNDSLHTSFDKMGYFQHTFKEGITMVQGQARLTEKFKWWGDDSKAHDFIIKMHSEGKLTESGGVYKWVG